MSGRCWHLWCRSNATCSFLCSAGTFSTVLGSFQESDCKACPENMTSVPASSSCVCQPGYTGEACGACAAGTYKVEAGSQACTACPALSRSAAASTAVTDCLCNAGTTGPNGGECVLCVPGKYKSKAGTESCHTCFVGKYSETIGATDHFTCQACPKGKYLPRNFPNGAASDCIPCAEGTYGDLVGQGACQTCPAGTWTPFTEPGLQWESIGTEQPSSGQQIYNWRLGALLDTRAQSPVEFTAAELAAVGVTPSSLSYDMYILVQTQYFKPRLIGATTCEECRNGTVSTADGCVACDKVGSALRCAFRDRERERGERKREERKREPRERERERDRDFISKQCP